MPFVIESKPSASASRACSRSSWKRTGMSSPSGNCARSIRPNCIESTPFERGLCPRNPGGGSVGAVEAPFDSLADPLRLPTPRVRAPFRLEHAAALHGEHGHHGLVDLHRV